MKYIVRYLSKRGMENETFDYFNSLEEARWLFDRLKAEYYRKEEIGLYSTEEDVNSEEEAQDVFYSGNYIEIEEVIR